MPLLPILPAPTTEATGGSRSVETPLGQQHCYRGKCARDNSTGAVNTASGAYALTNNTTGSFNTANGASALQTNTTGGSNTATGANALFANTTGSTNTATGLAALASNTTGTANTADGTTALQDNTTGSYNTATGRDAMNNNTTGNFNVGCGYQALFSSTTGASNTASGFDALYANTTGGFNVAVGANSLQANTIGINNVATGGFALATNSIGTNNTAIGGNTLFNVTGSSNTALGASAGADLTTGSNDIAINNRGVSGESGVIRIGTTGTQTATYVAGIWQAPITGTASPVRVNSSGKLGTVPSSARFKEAIKPMDRASEVIHALQPVSFRYRKELDPTGVPQFGLVAEDVAKVNPDLVVTDEQGKPFTVRYEEVNAMLLNEFLKSIAKGDKIAKSRNWKRPLRS